MSDPFIGQIIMFGGNFAPRGWALCQGQLLSISQNTALFSILGTTYGGDGRTTFGLPDLRGRAALHAESSFTLGNKGGAPTTTLALNNMPAHDHDHQLRGSTALANASGPGGAVPAVHALQRYGIYQTGAPDTDMDADAIRGQNVGGNQAFDNMAPYQAVHFIIALVGLFPSRP